jgi:3-phenylpropionate/trans-cinnamate dioxygenase ferredoxin reductase subunit
MTEASMVIVGGGKAGARAAVAFRENAWKGPVTLISDEALAPYDRPPLSKSAIMDEAEPQPTYLLDEGMMASLEVNFLRGSAATAIDRDARIVSLADGRKIPYDRLLIATGAEPRKLSLAGSERALLLRDIEDSINTSNFPREETLSLVADLSGSNLPPVPPSAAAACVIGQPRILMGRSTEIASHCGAPCGGRS